MTLDRPADSFFARLDRTHVPMIVARLVLGGLFIKMGVSKLDHPVKFLKDIREYGLLPEATFFDGLNLINLTAVALPWIEILCGLLLIVGLWLRGSSLVLGLMLAFFTTAIFWRAVGVYNAGGIAFCEIEFDCGCGAGPIVICYKLAENLSLLGMCVIALLSRSRKLAVESLPVRVSGTSSGVSV
ncbi:MAG: DoxX family protein [Phycisphaerales bacterium]|nr:DoxX family protein [Phycisphaerales bacterium]